VSALLLATIAPAAAVAQEVDVKFTFSGPVAREWEGAAPNPDSIARRKAAELANAAVVRDWLADNFRYWTFDVPPAAGVPAIEVQLVRDGQAARLRGVLRVSDGQIVDFFKPIEVAPDIDAIALSRLPQILRDRLEAEAVNQKSELFKILKQWAPLGVKAKWDGPDGKHSLLVVKKLALQLLSPCEILIEAYDRDKRLMGWVIGYVDAENNDAEFRLKAFHSDWFDSKADKRQPIDAVLNSLPWKDFELVKVYLSKEYRTRLRPVEE
jgi:hypothetical protein